MSEHDEQTAVFDVLRLNEADYPFLKWIYAIPNGGHRHPAVAGKLKAEGVKAGISDICIPIPAIVQGDKKHGGYIEMKFGKNKLTPEQTEFGNFLLCNGYWFVTAWNAEQGLAFIEFYLGIKLRK